MSLELAYFYGSEAEQYSFYRIPKVLLTDRRYKGVSITSLDRTVVAALIERVLIYKEHHVEIVFRWNGEFQWLMETVGKLRGPLLENEAV